MQRSFLSIELFPEGRNTWKFPHLISLSTDGFSASRMWRCRLRGGLAASMAPRVRAAAGTWWGTADSTRDVYVPHSHTQFVVSPSKRQMGDASSPSQQATIEKIHVRLVRDYIVRLLKKKVGLKSAAQQQNLAQSISKNAAELEAFCTKNVREHSLHLCQHRAWAR